MVRSPEESAELGRLRVILTVLVGIDLTFGFAFCGLAWAYADLRVGIFAAFVLAIGALLIRARLMLQEGARGLGPLPFCIIAIGSIGAWMFPSWAGALLPLSVLGILLVMPEADRPSLVGHVVFGGVSLLITAAAIGWGEPYAGGMPLWIRGWLAVALSLASIGATLVVCVQTRDRLFERAAIAQRQSDQLDAVMENMRDALVVLDGDLRVQMANQTATEEFNLIPESRFLDKIQLSHGTSGAVVPEELEVGALPEEATARLVEPVPIAGTVSRLGDGFVVTFRDATFERAARSHALELAASRGAADNLELLDSLAHDIRSPLNGILGFAEILLSGRVGPALAAEHREFVGDIAAAGKHLDLLATRYLDYTRLKTRAWTFDPEDTVLAEIAREAVAHLEVQAREGGVTVDVLCEPRLDARVDRLSFKQVLLNYLSNAIRFSPRGGRVEVEVVADAEWVTLTVRDQGPGVDTARAAQVFEPFAKGRAHEGGVGLGLAIVARLVQAQGGEVRAESNGHGAFVATFPRYGQRLEWTHAEDEPTPDLLTLLRRTVESLEDTVEICGADGVLLYVNPAFAQNTGYTPQEAVGRTPAELLRSDRHTADFFERIWAMISRGNTWRGEIVSRRKDGRFVRQDVTVSPVRDRAGRVTHYVAIKHVLETFDGA